MSWVKEWNEKCQEQVRVEDAEERAREAGRAKRMIERRHTAAAARRAEQTAQGLLDTIAAETDGAIRGEGSFPVEVDPEEIIAERDRSAGLADWLGDEHNLDQEIPEHLQPS